MFIELSYCYCYKTVLLGYLHYKGHSTDAGALVSVGYLRRTPHFSPFPRASVFVITLNEPARPSTLEVVLIGSFSANDKIENLYVSDLINSMVGLRPQWRSKRLIPNEFHVRVGNRDIIFLVLVIRSGIMGSGVVAAAPFLQKGDSPEDEVGEGRAPCESGQCKSWR